MNTANMKKRKHKKKLYDVNDITEQFDLIELGILPTSVLPLWEKIYFFIVNIIFDLVSFYCSLAKDSNQGE